MARGRVEVTGLAPLVRELRGPLFKDVNKELRHVARLIAADLAPTVASAVAQSNAPQAAALAATVRPHSDRVPVVVVGKTNPKFSTKFRGGNTRRRRGALAHGVVHGPAGGKRDTPVDENYYKIGRDNSGGALGRAARTGPIFDQATEAYLKQFMAAMRRHGFAPHGSSMSWTGRS